MTTIDSLVGVIRPSMPSQATTLLDPTVHSLRTAILGTDLALHDRVRDVVVGLGDVPRSDLTYHEQAGLAPGLLQTAIAQLGGSAAAIALDTQLRGVLCDWAAIAAPRLLTVFTGHFDLVLGTLLSLGNGSRYQQACLSELDTGAALGVLMLTELGGTNGADQQTTATWDPDADGFWLHTPSPAAAKFMPNVADARVAKTVVVTARLLVDGRDEGVLPFLLRLRHPAGVADGVEIAALPGKTGAAMDHALIRFDQTFVPRDGLLGGGWARINTEGRFESELPQRHRFHAAIASLGNGRLDLGNAAMASARAALAGLVNYSRQRRPGARGVLMADRDAVQRDLVTALAEVYAGSVVGRRLRDLRAAKGDADPVQALWSAIAKPGLSAAAHRVLLTCRERAAAQGALRNNYLVDWIANCDGLITVEGENQIMQITAGRTARQAIVGGLNLTDLVLPATPPRQPWYVEMLADREAGIARGLRTGTYECADIALGADSAAVDLAEATYERLAAATLASARLKVTDPHAKRLIDSAAAVYALERVRAHAAWFAARGEYNPRRAAAVSAELHRHRAELVDHLPSLVAAFDIPVLEGAPLFAPDYLGAWRNWAGWDTTTFATPRDTSSASEDAA
ncbi:acyl-CoA dehydrogenase family protein [Nocardia carnea]|uniref:acyl-CoA dehydrogenase family protein n=1 Tax=Nocardia carnea TaxID=37328 RepID=UPI002454EC95|nr:acyl-CoA dehydrogenase family protein [Nocardia carnea]